MKKLSELVAYKNELDRLSTEVAHTTVNLELGKISHLVNDADIDQLLYKINTDFDQFNKTFDQIKLALQDEISIAERPWIQEGYERYDKGEADYPDMILNLRQSGSLDIASLRLKLLQYSSWKHPAMVIRPGLESFIDDMTAFDPLYLVDLSHEFLQPAMQKFTEQYQNRLRPYVVREDLDDQILKQLPAGQFGFCLAFNYFNFRPFEIIKKYLEEIYEKLKPGGVFVFTFNDCDRRSAVELVERHFCSYTPGRLVRELIATVGYEIVYSWNDEGPTTWIEIRRPGNLDSLRGGQTLAKILPKPVANSK
jgi:SAM-dependent methyltransferase